jgi:ubiquitin-protein ligase
MYPSDSEEDDDDETESEPEYESMKTAEKKIKQLNDTLLAEKEKINNAANRLQICDNFGKSIAAERPAPEKLPDILKAYNEERKKIFQDHVACVAAAEKVEEAIAKAEKEKTKLAKELVKAQLKEQKEKTKLKEKKIRKKAELFKEKLRIKAERDSFWARKVYRITISLESSTLTPGSSRRSSITEGEVTNLATTTFHEPETLKEGTISLSISYITYSASWSPRYDLNLNSVKCSGVLDYGAELRNTTSETWRDAKVILSTSQTSFSGLNEQIPILHPWHVRLMKGVRSTESALMSNYEQSMKRNEWSNTINQSQKPRSQLFGVDNSAQKEYVEEHRRQHITKVAERGERINELSSKTAALSRSQAQFGQWSSTAAAVAPQSTGALFGGQGGGFGSSLFGSSVQNAAVHRRKAAPDYQEKSAAPDDEIDVDFGLDLDDGPSPARPDVNSLVFEEGAWEESGMTTTYDVPGLKTLAPSNSTIKHKIAKIDFKGIIFSHIVIGKLRQVAFLKARLRNASRITLLKGPLGLSLDGSFLGQATFPRCSAGESFSLPLGVDPAIQISYTKPTVRRSQSGIFSKEDSNVFTRSITITNTKNNAPVELTVLDQVPVSEDDRLRIEITAPRGLKLGSEPVRTGINTSSSSALTPTLSKGSAQTVRASAYGSENGKEVERQAKWGIAEATAKKAGEIAWNVKLNPGCGVKLVLEYEATFPGGECVVGV